MALKVTRRELKRKFKAERTELKDVIKLKCWDCTGFQADGYEDCGMDDCPLYPYRLNRHMSRESGILRTKARDLETKIQRS
jgi:hypothetical protein